MLLKAEVGGRRMDAEGWYREHTLWIWNEDDLPVNVIRLVGIAAHSGLVTLGRIQAPDGWSVIFHRGDIVWSTDYYKFMVHKWRVKEGFQFYSPGPNLRQWDCISTSVWWDNLDRMQPGWAVSNKVSGPIW